MDINATSLQDVNIGFKSLYDGRFSAASPNWNKVAMLVNSTSASMQYGWLGSSTSFREWVGDRVIQNLKKHSYEIKNKDFENTVGVARNDIEDDNIGVYDPLFQQLGDDAAMHPDELVFELLKSGFDTKCYDGQYFFDTDHPVVDENGVEQSVSNSGGGSGAPWFLMDDSKAIKPIIYQRRKDYQFVAKDKVTDDNVFDRKEYVYGVDGRCNVGFALWQLIFGSKQTLNAANYSAARTSLASFKGDNGRPLNVQGKLLVVGPSNESAAREILSAERNSAGSTNIHRGTAELLVCPYL